MNKSKHTLDAWRTAFNTDAVNINWNLPYNTPSMYTWHIERVDRK